MSGSTSKQARRAVRRATGDKALIVIQDLQESNRLLANSLASAHKRIDALETKSDKWANDWHLAYDMFAGLNTRFADFILKPWRARLRWILTGK